MTASNDGWVEWKGGECPVEKGVRVDVKTRSGIEADETPANLFRWERIGVESDIVAYRVCPPETQCCESVTRTIPDQPTIESLAADYRAKLAIYEQAQEEADSHRCGAEAALSRLQLAGWSIGLSISPQADGPKSEPENEPLNITDWRDLREGDEVMVDWIEDDFFGKKQQKALLAMESTVVADADEPDIYPVCLVNDLVPKHCSVWIGNCCDAGLMKWRFIRRP